MLRTLPVLNKTRSLFAHATHRGDGGDGRARTTPRRWHHDERGQVAPLIALSLIFFVIIGVMVIDIGRIYDQRLDAQAAADFAALAAAQELPTDPTDPNAAIKLSAARATATDYLTRNGFNPSDFEVDAIIDAGFGGAIDRVEVVVDRDFDWIFGDFLGLTSVEIGARAVARTNARPRDVAVVLDRSGSMCLFTHGGPMNNCPVPPGDPDGNGVADWQPFDQMRDATAVFAALFNPAVEGVPFDYLGLVEYSWSASVIQGMTTSYGAPGTDFQNAVDGMFPQGRTNIGHAIYEARTMLTNFNHPGAMKTIVVLSDGIANRCRTGGTDQNPTLENCNEADSEAYAIAEATAAAQSGIAIYTIGLTANSGDALLRAMADIGINSGGGGQFFDVDDPNQLADTFTEIADLLGVGLVE